MALPVTGQVGPQTLGDGVSTAPLRQGKAGDVIVSELHGRYFEQGYRANIFGAANQAAQAISVALATAYTGLLLYNPLGSGVILVPNKVKFAQSIADVAASTIGLISGVQTAAPTGTTALGVRSSQIGNAKAAAGLAFSVATIATPAWMMALLDAVAAAAFKPPSVPVDLEGVIQILPGGFLAIGALTAVTGLGSIFWEEVPV